jgi:hypothetical protein
LFFCHTLLLFAPSFTRRERFLFVPGHTRSFYPVKRRPCGTLVEGYEDLVEGYEDLVEGYEDLVEGYEDLVEGYGVCAALYERR